VIVSINDDLPLELDEERPLTINQGETTDRASNPYTKREISDLYSRKVEDKKLFTVSKGFKNDNTICEKSPFTSKVTAGELDTDFITLTRLRSKSLKAQTRRREMEKGSENLMKSTTYVNILYLHYRNIMITP